MNHPPLDVRWSSPMAGPAPGTRVAHAMTCVQVAVGALVVVLALAMAVRELGASSLGGLLLALSFLVLGAGNIWLGVAGRRRAGALLAAGREQQIALRITGDAVEFAENEAVAADRWPVEHVCARLLTLERQRWLVLSCPGREERHYAVAELALGEVQLQRLVDASGAG